MEITLHGLQLPQQGLILNKFRIYSIWHNRGRKSLPGWMKNCSYYEAWKKCGGQGHSVFALVTSFFSVPNNSTYSSVKTMSGQLNFLVVLI